MDVVEAVAAAVNALLADGGELVTVLCRAECGPGIGDAVAGAVREAHPDAEVHVVAVPGLPVDAQVGVE